jgi:ferric hydroxamate transport system ATP-binding protein
VFSVVNLSHMAGSAVLLEDISVELSAGRMTALVGHNGSGKSTLMRHLARQLAPSSAA